MAVGKFKANILGSLLSLVPLISGVSILPVSSSTFDISATIDTMGVDAVVSIEAGLTSDYGYEVIVNESPINGTVIVTALLSL